MKDDNDVKADGYVKADDVKVNDAKIEDDLKVDDYIQEHDSVQIENKSSVQTIFATAVISNTNMCQITPFHYQGLQSIFFSKDHLSKNVSSINYGGFTAYRQNSGKYELLLQIIIDVKTANLWESPRSYLFHHLGRERGTLKDGTSIQLVRIHQKR